MSARKSTGARGAGRGRLPRAHDPEQTPRAMIERAEPMLEVRVFYSQVPNLLADRFEVEVRIDADMGSLVRSNAALYAVRAILDELEGQQLLAARP